MSEIEKLKQDIIGLPVPFTSKGEQACKICDEMNQVCERNHVPPLKDAEFEDGDEILFRTSRRQEVDEYLLTSVYHAYHDGEYDNFQVGASEGYHDILAIGVAEQRRVDFGKLQTERFNLEYKPDPVEDAITLTDIEVLAYTGPKYGEPDQVLPGEEPPDPIYDIPGMWGHWPEGMQREIAEWITNRS